MVADPRRRQWGAATGAAATAVAVPTTGGNRHQGAPQPSASWCPWCLGGELPDSVRRTMPIRAAARPFVPGVVVAVWLAASVGFCGAGEGGSAAPASSGVDEVLEEERTFIDASRPTRANGSAPASDQRTLATRLWYAPMPVAAPACAGRRCALVLLGHGWGGPPPAF